MPGHSGVRRGRRPLRCWHPRRPPAAAPRRRHPTRHTGAAHHPRRSLLGVWRPVVALQSRCPGAAGFGPAQRPRLVLHLLVAEQTSGGIRMNTGVHKPYTDDGVTYCGWDGHEGCGEMWPCSAVRDATRTERGERNDTPCPRVDRAYGACIFLTPPRPEGRRFGVGVVSSISAGPSPTFLVHHRVPPFRVVLPQLRRRLCSPTVRRRAGGVARVRQWMTRRAGADPR